MVQNIFLHNSCDYIHTVDTVSGVLGVVLPRQTQIHSVHHNTIIKVLRSHFLIWSILNVILHITELRSLPATGLGRTMVCCSTTSASSIICFMLAWRLRLGAYSDTTSSDAVITL